MATNAQKRDIRRRMKSTSTSSNAKKTKNTPSAQSTSSKSSPSSTVPNAIDDNASKTQGDENDSLWKTFSSHPLIRVAPFVLIPYFIYNAVYFLSLKRPDIVKQASLGIVEMRPRIGAQDPRQVLILGSELKYNQYVADTLSKLFELEITQGKTDTENYFSRDGSVSWFHVLRYLRLESSSRDRIENLDDAIELKLKKPLQPPLEIIKMQAWQALCLNRTGDFVANFHPKFYNYSSRCLNSMDRGTRWSPCWTRECLTVVESEWGCAWNKISDQGSQMVVNSDCKPPFVRVLHQVRHPLHTIGNLVETHCPKQLNETNTSDDIEAMKILEIPFVKLVSSLFFERDWSTLSCVEAMASFVIDFHQTLLDARQAGFIHNMFHFEDTSPCQVAFMAGFLDQQTGLGTAYEPVVSKLMSMCFEDESASYDKKQNVMREYAKSQDTLLLVAEKESKTVPSNDMHAWTMEDFQGGKYGSLRSPGDTRLKEELKHLILNLGYSVELGNLHGINSKGSSHAL